jgi:hypothetical protein
MSYTAVDPVIRGWAHRHGFTLFDGLDGYPERSIRCVYVSSQRGECFQIWIDPPDSNWVGIHAADVETRCDEEMRHDLHVPLDELNNGLEAALIQVRRWMDR